MTNKQIQYGAIGVGVLLLLIFVFSLFGNNSVLSSGESVQLSSKQVQRSVNRSFPLNHSNARVKIKLKNPKVILKDGWEHIAINLDLNLAIKKRRANRIIYQPVYKGKVTLSGTIAYSAKSGSITINKAKLRVLNSKKLKAADLALIEKTLIPVLQKKLNRHPLYRLKGKQFKTALNKMKLSGVDINNNKINVELALK